MNKWWHIIGSVWLAVAAGTLSAQETQQPVSEQQFKDVAGQLRCPTCQGLSVLDSEAQFSVQIKDEVRKQLSEGKDNAQILAFFTERYGPWILREPPKEGVSMVAWLVPLSLLLGGPFLVWFFVWRRQKRAYAHGVRSAEDIIRDMHQQLELMRGRSS